MLQAGRCSPSGMGCEWFHFIFILAPHVTSPPPPPPPSHTHICTVFRSYSTFAYSALSVSGTVSATSNATITARVTNVAGPPGRETAQLYVAGALPGDPPKGLKGFAGTGLLAPGEGATLSFTLTASDASFYDTDAAAWALRPAGEYVVYVGASSVDLRLTGSVAVA